MRTITTIISAFILFAFFGCGNQDKSPGSEETISAPKLDLHAAIFMGDMEAVKQHIKAGSDLNVLEPSRKSTPLITAAALGDPEAAKLLIDAGADLNIKNADGSTALQTAVVFGKTKVAKVLINAGIKLNDKNNEGSTPLHTAAFFCREEIVKSLLEKGADKSIKNGNGKTALEIVSAPFDKVIAIYDAVGAGLKPLGIEFDYEHLKKTRPIIAEMLK